MKVLVVGGRGMLGRELQPRLEQAGFRVAAPGRSDLDITREGEVWLALEKIAPNLVIDCAAHTAVDRAESEPEAAFAVNRDGARNLARVCRRIGVPLLHLSTDYVFDGNAARPYKEEDSTHPLNVYGLSKWQGEEAIRRELPAHLIVRTSWLYGAYGRNFVTTILERTREMEEIQVVADQWGCPTWTGALAEALTVMSRRIQENPPGINWGTYHFCGAGYTTWYGLAREIVMQSQGLGVVGATRVLPVTTSEYPTLARRPRWSVLSCQKIEINFGIIPRPWQQGLKQFLRGPGQGAPLVTRRAGPEGASIDWLNL